MNTRILVVDDEPDIRFLLKDILEDEGYLVDVAAHARAANEMRDLNQPDLVLLDIWMPEIDGVTLLKEWQASNVELCPVVMMSGHGTVETAVEATKFGAYDFIEKPLSMAKLLSTVKAALASVGSTEQQGLRRKREEPVGNSQIVRQLKQQIQDLSKTNQSIFFTGTNGSGRKIWASYLTELNNPPESMRIFDINQDVAQLLPLKADLYVEEITDLKPTQQADLYRIINGQLNTSNYRLILSTRLELAQLLAKPEMLPELAACWRQAIRIPSIAEHIEDIPELLEYYVNWYSEHEQLPYRHFGVAAQNLLRNHHWSGDISQLKQFIKTVLSNSEAEIIELDEIRQTLRQSQRAQPFDDDHRMLLSIDLNMELREAREAFEREYLSRHLAMADNNITELARRVGQERTHLYRKLKTLGLHSKKTS